jgi:hypothetical protein
VLSGVTNFVGVMEKTIALAALRAMENRAQRMQTNQGAMTWPPGPAVGEQNLEVGPRSAVAQTRSSVRDDVYQVISELKHAQGAKGITVTILVAGGLYYLLASPKL